MNRAKLKLTERDSNAEAIYLFSVYLQRPKRCQKKEVEVDVEQGWHIYRDHQGNGIR